MLTDQPGRPQEGGPPPASPVTVHELLTAFDKLHVSQLKDPRVTRCKLRLYFDTLRPLPLESLTVPIVLEWYNRNKTRSQIQADGCISILRTAINRAIEWEMFKGANVAKLVRRKSFPRRKRYVMQEERPALITEIDKQPLMLRIYFYLLYYTGSRPGEIQRIQLNDLKIFAREKEYVGVLIKPKTKNGDSQQVPIPSFVCGLLVEYLATLPKDQTSLFLGSKGLRPCKEWFHLQWLEIRKRAGLGDVQQRDLRRTCATDLTPHLDLITISKGVLNHRDLNTTQIYVQPINSRIVDAMNLNVLLNRAHLTQTPVAPTSPATSMPSPEDHPASFPAVPTPHEQTMEWPG